LRTEHHPSGDCEQVTYLLFGRPTLGEQGLQPGPLPARVGLLLGADGRRDAVWGGRRRRRYGRRRGGRLHRARPQVRVEHRHLQVAGFLLDGVITPCNGSET